jgi:TATA-binding protein-associated factor Taf7
MDYHLCFLIVEDVEQEVERLLTADYEALDVTFEVLERKENEESENSDEASSDESLGVGINGQDDQDLDAAIDEAMIDEQEVTY